MTEPGRTRSLTDDHQIILLDGEWSFRCDAWAMRWAYRSQSQAAYFLAAHLLYPVTPCLGVSAPARVQSPEQS
jgi:hypothetical protein